MRSIPDFRVGQFHSKYTAARAPQQRSLRHLVCPLSRFGRPLSKTVYAHSSFDTKHIWLGPWPHRVSGKCTAAPLSHSVGSPQHLLEKNIPKIKSMYSDTISWEQTKLKGSASHRKNSFSIEHWYKNQETTRFWWLLPENYCLFLLIYDVIK